MAIAGDHVVVKLDDISGILRTFADGAITSVDLPLTIDQHDVTGFGDVVHNVINGQYQAPVTIKGYLTTNTMLGAGTHTLIYDAFNAGAQVTLRVAVGNNATPTTGAPEYSGEFRVESYKPVIETGKAVMFEATLKPAVGSGAGVPVWGTMA